MAETNWSSGGNEDRPRVELAREIDHEGEPGVRMGVWVGAKVGGSVAGAEALVLAMAVDADGAHAASQEVAHQVQAGLEDAGDDHWRPIGSCGGGIHAGIP